MAASGAKLIIGKGGMSAEDYKRICAERSCLSDQLAGTGALLGAVKKVVDVHWHEELGLAQAMWVIEVENMGPFIVESD